MLRPLSASVCGKYDIPSRRPYERIAEDLISACRKHVVVATGASPFKVGDNQRPKRTMSGVRKPSPESFVPAKTWAWGGGEDKVCGCRLNPSLIGEVSSSLAARCISQSGSVLRRLYLRPQPQTTIIFPRDERLIYTPHHPVRWPYRRRPHLLN